MLKNLYPLYPYGKLDVQSEAILQEIAESNGKPLASLTPQEARECFLENSWLGAPDKSIQIKNIYIDNSDSSIPLRIYTPEGKAPFPILLFFHGGGFVLGTLDEFDSFCTFLASGASCIVVSVGYRLAPENKHPAAVEDAQTALNWIAVNASKIQSDVSRIAVAGDSAGANLAAVASLIARDKSFPTLLCQILICPWLNLSSTETNSYKYFGNGLWLSTTNIHWYRDHYLKNNDQAKTYLASPLLAEKLSGLPFTLIITAEYDVLRDEGESYANRLEEASVVVKYTNYKGMLHDFVTLPGLFNKAKEAINEICSTLRMIFKN